MIICSIRRVSRLTSDFLIPRRQGTEIEAEVEDEEQIIPQLMPNYT